MVFPSFGYNFFAIVLQIWYWWLSKYSFRCFKHAGESYVKVPFLGAVSYLTLAVLPFCIVLAVVWAVYRRVSFAWIGQDILVRKKKKNKRKLLSSIFNFLLSILDFYLYVKMSYLFTCNFAAASSFVCFLFQLYWEMMLYDPFKHDFPAK